MYSMSHTGPGLNFSPWIENACFSALLNGPPTQERPRLAQVLSARISQNAQVPSLLIIHDGKNSVVVFTTQQLSPSDDNGLPQKGCIVRLSNWHVSEAHYVAGLHFRAIFSREDALYRYLQTMSDIICLSVENIQVLGGHGISIVGNPIPVETSIEIRRALLALQMRKVSVKQQLRLTAPLGDLSTLLSSPNRQTIASLMSLGASTAGGDGGGINAAAATTTTTSVGTPKTTPPPTTTTPTKDSMGVVLGDVRALFESSHNTPPHDNPVEQVFAMAHATSTSTTSNGTTTTTEAVAASSTTNGANANDGVVLGNVATLLEQNKDNMDAVFRAARAAAASSDGNDESKEQQQGDNEEEKAPPLPPMEPYGVQERLDSRASVVSLSGISSALRNLVGRQSFLSSAPETSNTTVEAEANEPMCQQEDATQSQQQDEEEESDSEQVVGITEMLISQTQDAVDEKDATSQDASEQNEKTSPSKKGTLKDSQSVEEDNAKDTPLETQPPPAAAATREQDDDYMPMNDDDDDDQGDDDGLEAPNAASKMTKTKDAHKAVPSKRRRKKKFKGVGMMELFKQQRARRKENMARKNA